jgi:hypothetical protein
MDEKSSINVAAVGARVGLRLGDKARGTMDWQTAQTMARELRALSGAAVGTVFYKFHLDGSPVYLDFQPQLARMLADALYRMSLLAEEHAKAEAIALDTAILYRSGAPFGLSNHPAIVDEAKKEAAWNTELRRCMPGGVKSEEAFGTPDVIRGRCVKSVADMTPLERGALLAALEAAPTQH